MITKKRILALLLLLAFVSHASGAPTDARRDGDPPRTALNLLFFGNSLTGVNQVHILVAEVAQAAGEPRPTVVAQILNGQTLRNHLNHPNTPGVIASSLAPGGTWDYTVLQDQSYRPSAVGDPAAFRADVAALFARVRAHSAAATGTLFENWPRDEGGWPYPPYVKIADMMADIRTATALARDDVTDQAGAGAMRIAPIGSAWEQAEWQNLHTPDRVHATPRGSLLAALVIYRKIYDDDTGDIPAANAAALLASLNLTAADWVDLTAVADRVDEVPAPHRAIYLTGEFRPGGAVKLEMNGPAGAAPAGFWIGAHLLTTPWSSAFGPWHLAFPVSGPFVLGAMPPDGRLAFHGNVPAAPAGPYTLHFQGMVQDTLTPPFTLEVE